jgi:hypothetical protein
MMCAGGLALLALLAAASDGRAWPPQHAPRRLAEATVSGEAQRVVVSEGSAKNARLLHELEQELRASSYAIVRVPNVALEPEAMLATLREARATRGILLSEDGKSVLVLAASQSGTTLRVYGEYSLDRDNRLARRRQWISLVERLRVPTDDEEDGLASTPWLASGAAASPPARVATATAKPPAATALGEQPDRRVYRLGVTVALGYLSGRTGFVSHLLLVGNRRLSPRISLIAHGLWPMVPGERVTIDGIRSRVWTFGGNVGLAGELGRPSWWASPYLGMTVGMQFLLGYVNWPDDPTTGTYRVGSLSLDLHAGVRFALQRGTWLLLQASGGRLSSLATEEGPMTDSLANGWAVRTALGLMMAL